MSAHASPAADGQQNGFTQVPNAILKANLSLGARMLYSILLSYCYHKDYCYPSYETLMQDLHCRSQALRKYITELTKHGLITVVRLGQGSTNRYYLTERVTMETPAAVPDPTPAAETSSLKIKEQELRKSQTEEYKAEEYISLSSDEERYSSNTRKTENSGHDYVNSHSQLDQQQSIAQPPHQTRVEQYSNERSTTARTIENIDKTRKKPPARENRHDRYEDIHRGVLLEYMSDFATEFNDQAPLTSSTTRAYKLFQQSGLTLDTFTTYLYTARAVTKERTASIRKFTPDGCKTKMAYFFAVLEDRLGLRQGAARTAAISP